MDAYQENDKWVNWNVGTRVKTGSLEFPTLSDFQEI